MEMCGRSQGGILLPRKGGYVCVSACRGDTWTHMDITVHTERRKGSEKKTLKYKARNSPCPKATRPPPSHPPPFFPSLSSLVPLPYPTKHVPDRETQGEGLDGRGGGSSSSWWNVAPRSVPTPRRGPSSVPLLLLLLLVLPLPRFYHRVSSNTHACCSLTAWASSTSLLRHALALGVCARQGLAQNGRGAASMPVSLSGGTRRGERE